MAIERTGIYSGRYHVLHGAIIARQWHRTRGSQNPRAGQARRGRADPRSHHRHQPGPGRRRHRHVPAARAGCLARGSDPPGAGACPPAATWNMSISVTPDARIGRAQRIVSLSAPAWLSRACNSPGFFLSIALALWLAGVALSPGRPGRAGAVAARHHRPAASAFAGRLPLRAAARPSGLGSHRPGWLWLRLLHGADDRPWAY